jgi:hypothetical protein
MPPDVCVVVPTIREYECVRAYVENAREHGFDVSRLQFVLVTEDFCETEAMREMLDELGVSGEVFDGSRREAWYEREGVAGFGHLVPAASHAETSFGLLYLWAHDESEYGVFIDDDTRPHEAFDFFGRHLRNLGDERERKRAGEDGRSTTSEREGSGEIGELRSDERWVNVLHENFAEHGLYPRGYPYSAMAETVETGTTAASDAVASQGLWTNVPDLDAVRILMDGDLRGQATTRLSRTDYGEPFVVAPGHYLTVCSMNLAFRREVVPAFYQLPMDDNPWGIGRFDDIWSGVFLKRACDVLDKQVVTGYPLCEHDKAPRSTFDDLANEAPALECNEHLWEVVDGVGDGRESYAGVYAAMADALSAGDFSGYANGAFLNHVGEHMHDWLACLDALAPGSVPRATSAPVADD